MFKFIVGFILGALVTFNTVKAQECPLSEGLVCGEWDYTGGRTPNDPIHHPLVNGNVSVQSNSFEETMQAFMIVIMAKALNDMDKKSNECDK